MSSINALLSDTHAENNSCTLADCVRVVRGDHKIELQSSNKHCIFDIDEFTNNLSQNNAILFTKAYRARYDKYCIQIIFKTKSTVDLACISHLDGYVRIKDADTVIIGITDNVSIVTNTQRMFYQTCRAVKAKLTMRKTTAKKQVVIHEEPPVSKVTKEPNHMCKNYAFKPFCVICVFGIAACLFILYM